MLSILTTVKRPGEGLVKENLSESIFLRNFLNWNLFSGVSTYLSVHHTYFRIKYLNRP